MTVAPIKEAGVLRDAMLLAMSSEVTRAGDYFSTSSEAAGMRVSIDVGTSRYHPSGNRTRHRRCSDHAGSIGRQCRGGRHAGSDGTRQLIEACHSLLIIEIIALSIRSGVDEVITHDAEVIVDRKLDGWIRLTVFDGIRIHVGQARGGGEGLTQACCHQALSKPMRSWIPCRRRNGDIGIPFIVPYIIGSAR
jgi:hypothetical protein